MAWLIDPEDRSVFIYQSGQELELLDDSEVILPMPKFMCEINYKVTDLFGLLQL